MSSAMDVDKVDLGLDTIIKMRKNNNNQGGKNKHKSKGPQKGWTRKQGGENGGGRGRGRSRDQFQPRAYPGGQMGFFAAPTAVAAASAFMAAAPAQLGPAQPLAAAHAVGGGGVAVASNKLLVSNLASSVSDSDVRELFSEFGGLRYSALHHDRAGRSLGTADVIFERQDSAVRAIREYHGVPLDGSVMNIQFAVNEGQAQAAAATATPVATPVPIAQATPQMMQMPATMAAQQFFQPSTSSNSGHLGVMSGRVQRRSWNKRMNGVNNGGSGWQGKGWSNKNNNNNYNNKKFNRSPEPDSDKLDKDMDEYMKQRAINQRY